MFLKLTHIECQFCFFFISIDWFSKAFRIWIELWLNKIWYSSEMINTQRTWMGPTQFLKKKKITKLFNKFRPKTKNLTQRESKKEKCCLGVVIYMFIFMFIVYYPIANVHCLVRIVIFWRNSVKTFRTIFQTMMMSSWDRNNEMKKNKTKWNIYGECSSGCLISNISMWHIICLVLQEKHKKK